MVPYVPYIREEMLGPGPAVRTGGHSPPSKRWRRASATEALGHSVIPKGLVERCSFQSPQKFINDLLHGMYTREYMAGHSVTGQSSSSCTEGKPGLAKQDLVEITNAAKLKFTYFHPILNCIRNTIDIKSGGFKEGV
ncbi:unnamed protein product [Gadus morhua 'NCC']